MKSTLATGPWPRNLIIGYHELSDVLNRPAGSLRVSVDSLPFKRWRIGRTVVWDADEVAAFVATKNQASRRDSQ